MNDSSNLSILEERQANMERTLVEIKDGLNALLQMATDVRLMQSTQDTLKTTLDKAFLKIDENRGDTSQLKERQSADRERFKELLSELRDSIRDEREKDRAIFLDKLEKAGQAFTIHKEEVDETINTGKGMMRMVSLVWSVLGGLATASIIWLASNTIDVSKKMSELDHRVSIVEMRKQ
jgi:hypothetical protein